MLGEFSYNGMEVRTMLSDFWYNDMQVCNMLGEFCYFRTMVRMFVPC